MVSSLQTRAYWEGSDRLRVSMFVSVSRKLVPAILFQSGPFTLKASVLLPSTHEIKKGLCQISFYRTQPAQMTGPCSQEWLCSSSCIKSLPPPKHTRPVQSVCLIPQSHALCVVSETHVTITDHYLSSILSLISTQ